MAQEPSGLPIGNPTTPDLAERTATEWGPRIQQMLDSLDISDPNQWVDATTAWGVTKLDAQPIQELLWNRFRDVNNPEDYGLRIIARRDKLSNKKVDPKTHAVIEPARYRLWVRLVKRGEMLELERDRANAGTRYS